MNRLTKTLLPVLVMAMCIAGCSEANYDNMMPCAGENNNSYSMKYKLIELDLVNFSAAYVFGDEEAEITVVEYASYECIDCAITHKNIHESIDEYLKNGIIRYYFKPVDHPKFENDLYINMYLVPRSYNDIINTFNEFKNYAGKDMDTIIKVLELDDVNTNFNSMNTIIESELNSMDISGTPTLIINNRKYSGIISGEQINIIINEIQNENE